MEFNHILFKVLVILLFLPLISAFDSETYISCGGDNELVINCISGDSQNSFLGGDSIGPTISLISPINHSEDTDGIVDFYYTVNDFSIIKNCSLYNLGNLKDTDVSIIRNTPQTFQVRNMQENDRLTWQIKCYDFFNNLGSSTIYFLDTQIGEGTGGGSTEGGGAISGNITNLNKENLICQEAYYFIINKLDKTGKLNYSQTDLANFADLVSRKLSIIFYESDAIKYIDKYNQTCYNLTSPIPLPSKEIKNLSFFSKPENVCNTDLRDSLISLNFPLPNIYFNLNSCENAKLTKWFFSIGKDENGYFISGIRAWIVLLFFILILIIWLRKYVKIHALTKNSHFLNKC